MAQKLHPTHRDPAAGRGVDGDDTSVGEAYRRRFDPRFRLVQADPAYQRARQRFGLDPRSDSIFANVADTEGARIRRLLASVSPQQDMVSYEHAIVDETGNLYWQQWTDRALFNNAGQLTEFRSLGRDITHQRLAQRNNETLARRRQSALSDIARSAVAAQDLDGFLHTVCEKLTTGLDGEFVFVLQKKPDDKQATVRAACGLPLGLIGTAFVADGAVTIVDYTLTQSAPVLVEDLAADGRFSVPGWLLESGAHSGANVVIADGDAGPWGVLAVFSRSKRRFHHNETALLRSVAELIGDTAGERVAAGQNDSLTEHSELVELKRNQQHWARKYAMDKLLRDVAVAANQAETREDVYRIALSRICAHSGWPLGHVFQHDEQSGQLTTSRVWHLQDQQRFAGFKQVTEAIGYANNAGLPGRAAAGKQPLWIADLVNEPGFKRAQAAQDNGICSGFAVPILLEDTVVAVLEFFTDQPSEPDQLLIQTLKDIAAQISPVIDRTRAEERIQTQIRQQKMIAMLGQDALSGLQHSELFLRAALTIRGTLDVELCDVLELQSDNKTLLLKEGVGWQEGKVGHVTIPARVDMLPGYALTSEFPVISDVLESGDRFQIPELYLSHGVACSLCVPIVGSKGAYGVLGVHSRKLRRYSQEQIAFVQSVASVMAQVVERQQAEEALRDSRERFATLAANIPGFVFRLVMDKHGNGSFAYVSPGAREIFEQDPASVMSDVSPLIECIHPDDRAGYYRSVAESAQSLQQWNWGGRISVGGDVKWLQGMARPFRGPDGSTLWDGVILDETARKDAEIKTQDLLKDNRQLTKKLLTVQEEEYKRLARELHDELGQSLTAIKSDAILIEKHSDKGSKAYISAVAIEEAAEHIYGITHAMMRRLRPSTLDELGLVDTLNQMASDWKQRSGIGCTLQVDNTLDELDDEYAMTIYRIIQESLTNVERHSGADQVEIFINLYVATVGPGYLVLYVKDNGRGADPPVLAAKGHYGLLGIRERVEAIGGYLEITSKHNRGFQLRAHIPLLPSLIENAKLRDSTH